MADAAPIVDDLRAESDELDALVAPLSENRWREPTPAQGWTIAHQISHLLWTDRVALTSVTDEPGFGELLSAAAADPTGFVDAAAEEESRRSADELLADWRATRRRLHDALLEVPPTRKLVWFGPPMSASSMATARLMETWAHGLDVADALGVQRGSDDRLRSIAHLGVRTRDYAFAVHGLPVPAEPFRVELRAPAARPGRGVRRTRRSGSPVRRWTSATWSPSGGRCQRLTSRPWVTTRNAGSRSRRRSRGRPALGASSYSNCAPVYALARRTSVVNSGTPIRSAIST